MSRFPADFDSQPIEQSEYIPEGPYEVEFSIRYVT